MSKSKKKVKSADKDKTIYREPSGWKDNRSAHAIAVDRGIQARRRYATFADGYKAAPNESDVVQYDTRYNKAPPKRARVKPKPKPIKPTKKQDKAFLTIFHRLPVMQQFEDLQSTRNVARTPAQVEAWKKDPSKYDIQGIDTRPVEFESARIDVAHKAVGKIPIVKKRLPMGERGRYTPKGYMGVEVPEVIVHSGLKRSDDQYNITLAHELGHAFDQNVKMPLDDKNAGVKLGGVIGGFKFSNAQYQPMLSRNPFRIQTDYSENFKEVEKVGREANPYNRKYADRGFKQYRDSNHELFANWFAGLVTRPKMTEEKSPKFTKKFKAEFAPFAKELDKAGKEALMPFMKVPKGFKW
jgi:hypothetical protein